MTAKSRRGLFAVLAVGVIGVFAVGASSASAVSVTGQPVAFKAFVDNGFDGSIISTAGASVNAECSGQELTLVLRGTASNGLAKSNYNDESNAEQSQWNDDFDTGDNLPLNDFGIGSQVIGHAEFTNGQNTRTMTVDYMTEDDGVGPNGARSDCMVTGSAIRGSY